MFALGHAPDPGSHEDTQHLSKDTEYQSWQGLVLLGPFIHAEAEAQIHQVMYSGSQIADE